MEATRTELRDKLERVNGLIVQELHECIGKTESEKLTRLRRLKSTISTKLVNGDYVEIEDTRIHSLGTTVIMHSLAITVGALGLLDGGIIDSLLWTMAVYALFYGWAWGGIGMRKVNEYIASNREPVAYSSSSRLSIGWTLWTLFEIVLLVVLVVLFPPLIILVGIVGIGLIAMSVYVGHKRDIG